MSLKVWLPLDGDLRNLGASDVEIVNNGATIDNAGKIGKCYYFNGSAQYLQLNKTLGDIYSGDFSWCVWLKPTDDSRGIIFSEYAASGSSGVAFELLANRVIRVYWNGSPDWNFGISINKDEWSHVAITKKNNTIKVYVNGQYKTEKTGTLSARPSTACIRLGDDYRGGTGVSYMGYMNDARIYDHCLSAAEVHEIAMGLVLHYKLDGNDIPNENLGNTSANYNNVTNGYTTTASKWGGDNGTVTYYHFGGYAGLPYKVYHKTATGDGGIYSKTANDIILEANTTYTMSCWIKSSRKITNAAAYTFNINRGSDNLYITYGKTFAINTEWTFYSKTFTTTDDQAGSYGEMSILYDDGEIDYYVYYSGFKIEKGSTATRWTPPGEQYNIIQDSSGYGHNGTITGNITASTPTPRYSACNNFPDSDCSIGIGNLSTLIPEGIFTFNIWFKKITDEWSSKNYETILGGPSGFELEAKVGGTNSPVLKYYNWGGGTTNYTLDEWHMITMIRTTANTQFYLDGELKVTGSAGSIPSGDYFIGAWKTATAQNYRGYLSDARIYCTPLLDNDIKMLYNIGMRVDNLGGIHSFEFKEAGGRELIQGIQLTKSYGNHDENSNPYLNYNSDGEIILTGYSSIGSKYIPISPTEKTYYYDIEVSIAANNQFYFGFERYDADKTARSNNACTYVIAEKPTSDLSHKRYFGTVNLSTDGTNPCAFIAVRILNDWNNASGRTAIVHKMSLREVSTFQKPKLYKTGTFLVDELNEHQKAAFYNNNIVEATEFIEK